MKLAIDASNIRSGGTVNHLRSVLREAAPERHGFERVYAWGSAATLAALPDRPWLERVHVPALDRSLPWRAAWQQLAFPAEAARRGCAVVFSPGGTLPWRLGARACVLSQNLLPFEPSEARRYGVGSAAWLRLRLLRLAQGRSMLRAHGVAFLTSYAKAVVESRLGAPRGAVRVIPHGVDESFLRAPRPQRPPSSYAADRPFTFLYVSTVDAYKHQADVAAAVAALRRSGLPVALTLAGAAARPAEGRALARRLLELDPHGAFLKWKGLIPYRDLPAVYHAADAFVFASTCESSPLALVEAMGAGLPIACARAGPMPELAGEGAAYYEAGSEARLTAALRALFEQPDLRARLAAEAFRRAEALSWKRCAELTFQLIAECARSGDGPA